VIVGPRRGFDNAVLSLGEKVMVLTTDPVSMIPHLGAKTSAWLSVHLIASDYVTSGLSPEFASFDLNFPPEMSASDEKDYLTEIGRACRDLGVSIVAGHTGSYPGAGFTVIGGGVMFGFGSRGSYVDPSMAHEGDAVVMTKGVAIEAVATLASSFPQVTEQAVGHELAVRARQLVKSCSVVKDALAAASIGLGAGKVTSMHDATEGGIIGGLDEMATASGHSIVIDEKQIPIPDEVMAVCSAFGIDPLSSLSEGTLLITVGAKSCDELQAILTREHIVARRIGEVRGGSGLWLARKGKRPRRARPGRDSYWGAYSRAESATNSKPDFRNQGGSRSSRRRRGSFVIS
jgi:hydrogenase maturation factor